MYATRDIDGKWSKPKLLDATGDVGGRSPIAIDSTGKIGVAYFDVTNTAVKYINFDGYRWMIKTIESDKHVGTHPSLAFDIDGNAYLAYERRSGGYLRLAALDRDTGAWTRRSIDGGNGTVVASSLSLDVGEAAVSSNGFFTTYDTTVAIAYADVTNGNLKYARLDVDNPSATWFVGVAEDTNGIGAIDLNLHAGPSAAGLQAQIAYQTSASQDVKYAFKTGTDSWTAETVATDGDLGAAVALSFNSSDTPTITYFDDTRQGIYTATRTGTNVWSSQKTATGSSVMSVSFNERTGEVFLSYLNRQRTDVFSNELV